MLHPRGLVVLVILFDEDGKGVWGLGCGAVPGSLCLGGHLLPIHHQLKPGGGLRLVNKELTIRSSTCRGSDRTLS